MFGAEDFMVVRAHKIHFQSSWPMSPSSLPPHWFWLADAIHSHCSTTQHHPPSPHDSVLGYASHLEPSRWSWLCSNHWVSPWQHVPVTHPSGRIDRALFSRPLLEASLVTHPLCRVGKWPISSADAAPFFLCPLFVQGQQLLHNLLIQRRILYNI